MESDASFPPNVTRSQVHFVDLAGSERISATETWSHERMKERGNINKSLVVLGNVIRALVNRTKEKKGRRTCYVPYRHSVLTWLLRNSLGGNSRMVMLACVSPSEACYSETVGTLRFAQTVQCLSHSLVVTRNQDCELGRIAQLKAEIMKLSATLTSLQKRNATGRSSVVNLRLERQRTLRKLVGNKIKVSSFLCLVYFDTLLPIYGS